MKIPSTGNYLTEDKQTAIVDELDEKLCYGRVGDYPVIWEIATGKATSVWGKDVPSLSIVSPAPIPWRERILQLIETAHRAGGSSLVNGDITFYMECSKVIVSREAPKNVRNSVHLTSPEIIGAFKARMTQLAAEAARARDDAHSTAIEALLQ